MCSGRRYTLLLWSIVAYLTIGSESRACWLSLFFSVSVVCFFRRSILFSIRSLSVLLITGFLILFFRSHNIS